MSSTLAVAALLFAAPAVGDLWPCDPGNGLEYRIERAGAPTGTTVREVVLGSRPGRLCAIERTTKAETSPARTEIVLVERLADRLLWAGEAGALTALRPPLVKAPVAVGTKWSFAGVRYRIVAVDEVVTVPAGRFADGVRVAAKSVEPGAYAGFTVYVAGIGPVLKRSDEVQWVAVRRVRASPKSVKSSTKTEG